MATLERIIRPFEVGSPFTSRKLAPSPAPANVEATPSPSMTWGKPEPVDYTAFVFAGIVGFKHEWKEEDRKTKTERIYQNNDETSDNWVDVEVIEKLKLVSNTGEEINWSLDPE